MPDEQRARIIRTVDAARKRGVEFLRWRVGYYDGVGLPEFPANGLRARNYRIRPFVEQDVKGYTELANSDGAGAALLRPLSGPPSQWVADRQERVTKRLSPYELAIVEGEQEKFVGACMVESVRDIGFSVEYGIALVPDAYGSPSTFRATRAIFDWLFEHGVHRIVGRHLVSNTASHRSLISFGVAHEGVMRGVFPPGDDGDGVWLDACIHAIVNPAHNVE